MDNFVLVEIERYQYQVKCRKINLDVRKGPMCPKDCMIFLAIAFSY